MRVYKWVPAALAVLGVLAAASRPASACTIDSVPSATAAGRTAIIYDVAPGSVDPAHYAAFIFPGSFGAGWPIRFGELSQGLALSPRQLRAPWSWEFGDGTTGWGHAVSHTYRHPGEYVITVSAHVHGAPYPFPFDRILVRVLAPGNILATEGPRLLNGSRFDAGAALLGGLLPLQREADKGLIARAVQTLGQIQSGAWASIKDYWLHARGSLPAAYGRVDALLRQESGALDAHDGHRAAAIADALPAAWAATGPQHEGLPWLPIGAGAAGLLVAAVVARELRGWRKLLREERLHGPEAG